MNPVINLPKDDAGNIIRQCPDEQFEISAICAGTPSRVEWEVINRPPGGSMVLNNTVSDAILAEATANGNYTVQFCCFYETGSQGADQNLGPFVDCPFGRPWGTSYTVSLIGCEDADSIDWVVNGAQTVIDNGDSVTIGTASAAGIVQIQVTCNYDNQLPITIGCDTVLYDPAQPLQSTDSQPVCFDFVQCETICFCSTVDITIDCEQTPCTTDYIYIKAKPELVATTLEECEPAQEVPLVGLSQSYVEIATETDIDCDCDEAFCCPVNPDRPNFIWNDCSACPNWSVAGEAANASDCSVGNPWCFDGTDTYQVSSDDGSECSVDIIVIYGHNIESATISASVPIFGGDKVVSVCFDEACIGGYTRPIVVPLDGLYTDTSFSFTVSGNGINNQPICIDYAMFGQKLFLPDDLLPDSFVNPLDGSDYEFNVKSSQCGPISRVAKQTTVSWELTFEADQNWIKRYWRSYLRYLNSGQPVLFQPSRNNCPDDILLGYLSGTQLGSTLIEGCDHEVTLSVQGNVNQPQPKSYV